ncbi:MAG: succinate dehydrogenase, hydrophobic membrane anchor protein [Ahniella sp.]|nr:succinate dehydrogenase, hydrophobic membrane anchor protein [Ahniella sp.]
MSLQTPLGRVRGLGSAREGVAHWWAQRVSAVLLLPLSIWFLSWVLPVLGQPYSDARVFVAQPLNAFLLLTFMLALIYHALLGVQVVIEDYLHTRWLEVSLQVAIKLIAFLAALATAFALIRIVLGA